MQRLILIGLGGGLGACLRFLLGDIIHKSFGRFWLPAGTLTVNVIGCLLIGFVSVIATEREWISFPVREFLMVGILGGFTTYSSFGLQTVDLFSSGSPTQAFVNIALHLLLGLSAVWLGMIIGRFV